jgi:uncharacterized protein YcbX
VTAAHLASIWRHPIKAHGREALAEATLAPGACLPGDRAWALAHDATRFDPEFPAWTPCASFQRGARTPALMAIEARWDEAAGLLTLTHPDLAPLTFDPETEGDRFVAWVLPISPEGMFAPRALVAAPGRGMTDSPFASVSVKSVSSLRDLSARMGRELSPHRFRGNLWVEGWEPWAEEGLVGRRLRVGEAVLEVRERVGRCRATHADPATGRHDADVLPALLGTRGETVFGLYAVVAEGGRVRAGDPVAVL